MLHEEEFFDAIDATLDKWDKEEEKVRSTYHFISYVTSHFTSTVYNSHLSGWHLLLTDAADCLLYN